MKQQTLLVLVSQLTFFVLLGLYSLTAAANTSNCPDNAQEYWKTFHIAAIRGDVEKVANASRFPFNISGTLDESEKRHIDRQEFIRLLPVLLKTDPGLSLTPTTMKSLLKATPRLLRSFCNSYGNQLHVGTWVFELTPDGWRFVQAFVDN